MATLNTTNIKHASSSSNNIVLASDGKVTFPSNTGNILQVIEGVKEGATSTSTTATWQDISGFSASITMTSSTNKVLILVSYAVTTADVVYVRLKRGSTILNGASSGVAKASPDDSGQSYVGVISGGYRSGTSTGLTYYGTIKDSCNVIDTPGAGTHTYQMQWQHNNSTAYLNRGESTSNQYNVRTNSFITLMEVAA